MELNGFQVAFNQVDSESFWLALFPVKRRDHPLALIKLPRHSTNDIETKDRALKECNWRIAYSVSDRIMFLHRCSRDDRSVVAES